MSSHHVSHSAGPDVSLEVVEHRRDPFVRNPVHQLEHQLQLLSLIVPDHVRALRQDRLLL